MQKRDSKILTCRVPGAIHEKLLEQAALEGATVSDVARSILEQHIQVSAVLARLNELDISRRFRELFAQARCAVIAVDTLARYSLEGNKYDSWLLEVKEGLDIEAEKREGVNK